MFWKVVSFLTSKIIPLGSRTKGSTNKVWKMHNLIALNKASCKLNRTRFELNIWSLNKIVHLLSLFAHCHGTMMYVLYLSCLLKWRHCKWPFLCHMHLCRMLLPTSMTSWKRSINLYMPKVISFDHPI
jgi:hypothetical protein